MNIPHTLQSTFERFDAVRNLCLSNHFSVTIHWPRSKNFVLLDFNFLPQLQKVALLAAPPYLPLHLYASWDLFLSLLCFICCRIASLCRSYNSREPRSFLFCDAIILARLKKNFLVWCISDRQRACTTSVWYLIGWKSSSASPDGRLLEGMTKYFSHDRTSLNSDVGLHTVGKFG